MKGDFAVERGQPDEAIASIARDVGADMIVMTTHGRAGVEQFFISDAAERIIRNVRSPVLLIRPTEEWRSRRTRFQRLLVGLDGSWSAERVLRYARTFAQAFESEILLLGVPEADFEEPELLKYLEGVAGALRGRKLKARAIVTGSGTARTIVAVSESEDGHPREERPRRFPPACGCRKRGQPSDPNHATSRTVGGRVGRRIHPQTAVSTCYSGGLSCHNLIGIDIDRRWRSRWGNGSSMSSCLNKLKMEK